MPTARTRLRDRITERLGERQSASATLELQIAAGQSHGHPRRVPALRCQPGRARLLGHQLPHGLPITTPALAAVWPRCPEPLGDDRGQSLDHLLDDARTLLRLDAAPKTKRELIALLASIPDDVPNLSDAESMILYDLFTSLYGAFRSQPKGGTYAQDNFKTESGDWMFTRFHLRARWIAELLDGKTVYVDQEAAPQPVWRLNGDRVTESWPKGEQTWFGELVELIRTRPFPFRRCKRCERVFVRSRRRLFCSPACTYEWHELNRDKDTRREYMRKHMRKVRARVRKKASKRR